ncbi:MAG: hypothetical protein V1728_02045 [Candidatus Micrarchaeota archaeon]
MGNAAAPKQGGDAVKGIALAQPSELDLGIEQDAPRGALDERPGESRRRNVRSGIFGGALAGFYFWFEGVILVIAQLIEHGFERDVKMPVRAGMELLGPLDERKKFVRRALPDARVRIDPRQLGVVQKAGKGALDALKLAKAGGKEGGVRGRELDFDERAEHLLRARNQFHGIHIRRRQKRGPAGRAAACHGTERYPLVGRS